MFFHNCNVCACSLHVHTIADTWGWVVGVSANFHVRAQVGNVLCIRLVLGRVGHNHTCTVQLWQEIHQIYGHIRRTYTVLATSMPSAEGARARMMMIPYLLGVLCESRWTTL